MWGLSTYSQGSNPSTLHLKLKVLTTGPTGLPGSPKIFCPECLHTLFFWLIFSFQKTSYFVLGYSWLTNNVVIASDKQRRDSAIHTHAPILPQTPTLSHSSKWVKLNITPPLNPCLVLFSWHHSPFCPLHLRRELGLSILKRGSSHC